MFDDDILSIIIMLLDVKSSIKLLMCNKYLMSRSFREVNDRKYIVKELSLLNYEDDKNNILLEILNSACKFGYLEIIKQYIGNIEDTYGVVSTFLSTACVYGKHNIVKYMFKIIIHYDSLNHDFRCIDKLCEHTIIIGDMNFIDKLICYNIRMISRLMLWAAIKNNLNLFTISYNCHKHIYKNNDGKYIYMKDDKFYLCPEKGFHLINGILIKPITSKLTNRQNIKQLFTNTALIEWSCENDSRDIIIFLIVNGLTNYDQWLTAAIKYEQEELINFFIKLGGTNICISKYDDDIFIERSFIDRDIKDILVKHNNISKEHNPYDILSNDNFSDEIIDKIDNIILSHIKEYFIETIKLRNTKLLKRILIILNNKYKINDKCPNLYKFILEISFENSDINLIIESIKQF